MITPALIDKAKASGFDAIRLPCSWNQYADAAPAKISAAWLGRALSEQMHRLVRI